MVLPRWAKRVLVAGTAAVIWAGAGAGVSAQTEPGFLENLERNAIFNLQSWAIYFYDDHPDGRGVDDTDGAVENRLTLATNAVLNEWSIFEIELRASYNTGDHELRGVHSEPGIDERKGKFLDTRKIFLRIEQEEFDVLIGKALLPVGVSTIYSPANRFQLIDAINPMHITELGVWQTTANFFIEDDTLSFSLLPYHQQFPSPDLGNRWIGVGGNADFFTLPDKVVIDGKNPEIRFRSAANPGEWGYMVHYKAVRSGYDYFLLAHHGPSIYPVISQENQNTFFQTSPLATTLAGGISATIESFNFYGEVAAQRADDDNDEDFIKSVLGVSYRETDFAAMIGLEEIMPTLEYSRDFVFDNDVDPNIIVVSREARPGKDTVFYNVDFRYNDEYSFNVFGVNNLGQSDRIIGVGAKYEYSDNLEFKLTGRRFRGSDTSQFGRWRNNDHLELNMRFKF